MTFNVVPKDLDVNVTKVGIDKLLNSKKTQSINEESNLPRIPLLANLLSTEVPMPYSWL